MLRKLSVVITGAILLAGCSSPDTGPGGGDGQETTTVTFALDWAPNTNHTGIFVAQEKGWFDEAGLEVEILPYASTPVPELVSGGGADFGIGGQAGVQLGRTSGLDVVSVYRITQGEVGELVVLGDRDDITSPKDLDGTIFGGFGSPLYSAMVRSMIRFDGGEGDIDEVTLDAGAYEALSSGSIDSTLSVRTWESVNAKLEGHPYKSFAYQDYGMPNVQAVGIISSDAYLEQNPEVAAAFIGAVQRGYEFAAQNPKEAGQLLIDANPDVLASSEELVQQSLEVLSQDGMFVSDGVVTGSVNPQVWQNYGQFLIDNDILTDAEGNPVTEAPNWAEYYTNEFTQ